ncbi:MAG TPA: hypothetical protein VFV79_08930 [Saprospiraceae bacterium]|nr:hypothetical protein [Saprospiraceae bacterium]
MEQKKANFFDSLEQFLKIGTPIGAIVAFVIGVYHYRDSQAEDFKRTYWEKRYAVYEQATLVSSQAANANSQEQLDSLKPLYWITFTGKSMLVEDLHVFNAMTSFGESMNRALYPDSMKILISKAHAISKACRTSLKETWEPVPLVELEAMEK